MHHLYNTECKRKEKCAQHQAWCRSRPLHRRGHLPASLIFCRTLHCSSKSCFQVLVVVRLHTVVHLHLLHLCFFSLLFLCFFSKPLSPHCFEAEAERLSCFLVHQRCFLSSFFHLRARCFLLMHRVNIGSPEDASLLGRNRWHYHVVVSVLEVEDEGVAVLVPRR